MLLDDLYQTIEKLRERMETHQDKLKQSEALTRNALVDPLLRALGWDTEDPALAMPEYRLGSGFADYALLNGGKPVIVIEAKKLGTPLYSAAEQSVTYCVNAGIRYFVATDGRKWDVYETHRPVPLAEKKIVSFDITDSPADVCLDALVLWRRSVQSGIVRKAQTPLLEPQNATPVAATQPEIKPEPSIHIEPCPAPFNQQAKAVISPISGANWQKLTDLQAVAGEKPPPEIRFPDGSLAKIQDWVDIPVQVVRWLCQQDKLDETRIPVRNGRGKNYLLAGSPYHSTGKKFVSSKVAEHLYLEGTHSGDGHVKNVKTIVNAVGIGVTPADFSVRLS